MLVYLLGLSANAHVKDLGVIGNRNTSYRGCVILLDGPKVLLIFLQIQLKEDNILSLAHKFVQFRFFELVEEVYVLVTTGDDRPDSWAVRYLFVLIRETISDAFLRKYQGQDAVNYLL